MPPAILRAAETWLEEVDAALPGAVSAFFVVGSAALGAFQPGHSDVDFVAVAAQLPHPGQLPLLTQAHRRAQRAAGHSLDGCMVTKEALRGQYAGPILRFHDGRVEPGEGWRTVSVDAHVLREYGVPLRGHSPAQLMPPTDWDALCVAMVDNLNTYWRRWRQASGTWNSTKGVGLLWNKQVEWGVLGVSRIAYSLREHAIIGKTGAGQYMLGIAPSRWHAILREALRPRLDGPARFPTPFARRREALAYIDWVIGWASENGCR